MANDLTVVTLRPIERQPGYERDLVYHKGQEIGEVTFLHNESITPYFARPFAPGKGFDTQEQAVQFLVDGTLPEPHADSNEGKGE